MFVPLVYSTSHSFITSFIIYNVLLINTIKGTIYFYIVPLNYLLIVLLLHF
nr:MAG TPA: hypothetical protein [Caudoviricetes sp.]